MAVPHNLQTRNQKREEVKLCYFCGRAKIATMQDGRCPNCFDFDDEKWELMLEARRLEEEKREENAKRDMKKYRANEKRRKG